MIKLRADRRKESKRVRRALLVIGALVFCFAAAVAVMVWWLLNVYVPQNQANNPSSSASDPAFSAQDRFATLVVLHDEQTAAFLLVDCDAEHKTIDVIGIPANTVLDLSQQTTTLQALFYGQGHAKAGQALSAQLNREIRYTMAIGQQNMVKVLDRAGSSLEYTFDREMSYVNTVGITVQFRAGERYSLSSAVVKDLLFCREESSAADRAQLAADLFAQLICQKMTAPSRLSAIFSEYINLVDSNISIADFVAVSDALEHLAQHNTGALAVSKLQKGQAVSVGGEELYYCETAAEQIN